MIFPKTKGLGEYHILREDKLDISRSVSFDNNFIVFFIINYLMFIFFFNFVVIVHVQNKGGISKVIFQLTIIEIYPRGGISLLIFHP